MRPINSRFYFSLIFISIVLTLSSFSMFGCASSQSVHASSASALYNKGVHLFNKGRYSQAKEVFHEYISEYADSHLYAVSLYYLAYCYQKLNDPKQANLIYHKVIDESTDEFWIQMSKKRIQELEIGG